MFSFYIFKYQFSEKKVSIKFIYFVVVLAIVRSL